MAEDVSWSESEWTGLAGTLHSLEAEPQRRPGTGRGRPEGRGQQRRLGPGGHDGSGDRGQRWPIYLVPWRLLVSLQGQLVGVRAGVEGSGEGGGHHQHHGAGSPFCRGAVMSRNGL